MAAAVIRGRFVGLIRNFVQNSLLQGFVPECRIHRANFHLSTLLNVAGQEIRMPSLSPTMAEGVIVKWLKQEGDSVSPGDVLCEIQTDKAVMSFETDEEGILAKILVPENVKDVKVGTLIALMVAEGEDWRSVEMPSNSSITSEMSTDENEQISGSVPGISISMPSLSPTMTEGTIVKWYKKEGDAIAAGDVLCDIQTDKAVMSFEMEEEGILAKIIVPEGTTGVKVGSLIALTVAEGENWQDVMIPRTDKESPIVSKSSDPPRSIPESVHHNLSNFGPAVRILIERYQLNPSQIVATGKHQKLLKSDVLNFITEQKLTPKPPIPVPLPEKKSILKSQPTTVSSGERPVREKFIDIEVSSMRRTIAKRLTESKMSIPHAYATVECDIDHLLSFRKQLKSADIVVSVNDFIVKAVALALKECPLVNCLFMNDQAVPAPGIDISVAVATDSGLITPIVKNAHVKSVDEISSEVKELAARARAGKLQLHEFQGGSFTISNLGMYGISEFSAIINPPQCGILAVAGGRTVIDIDSKPITKITSTLSYDARAISEAAASDFLEMFQVLINNPANLLLGTPPKRQKAVAK